MKIISGKEIVRILQKKGWYIDHINGSHHIMKKDTLNYSLTIPVHRNRDLKKGIQAVVMKLSGLTEQDLS